MKALLITIGDEILSGSTVDTNSSYIAARLRSIGIAVTRIFTVPDQVPVLLQALDEAFALADLVITTGGLGPTKDDRTKLAFATYFQDELFLDPETHQHLETLLQRRNRSHLLEINRAQAMVLRSAQVFQNYHGTAPCQLIEKNGKIAICLPGVPFEMKPLIKDQILPYLQTRFSRPFIITKTLSVTGYPESALAQTLEEWEDALPAHISLSYLPVGNRVKLRLTAIGGEEETLHSELDARAGLLTPLLGHHLISTAGDEIQEILKEILIRRKLTLSTAESYTGGELARLLTSVPGASDFFLGGVISYDTSQKIALLKVSRETISEKTTVSEEVAQEMALGCQQLFGSDISLSTTGVAGPASDDFQNEIGTVFYTVRVGDEVKTNRLFLPHLERTDFMAFVSQRVVQDLVEVLVRDDHKQAVSSF